MQRSRTGAAQALVTACLLPMKLGGVSSLVGFLPLEQKLEPVRGDHPQHCVNGTC